MSSDSRRLFTDYQVRQLLIACNCRCERCGVDVTDQPFEAHHIRRHTDGGQTQLYNGMILCKPCHKEVTNPMFVPRKWQEECFERFKKCIAQKGTFIFEACMGAGKSAEAAMITRSFLDDFGMNHVLVLVPWTSIQGDTDKEKGMLGTFGTFGVKRRKDGREGIDCRDQFFAQSRRLPRQPRPETEATIALYHQVCCPEAIETLQMWKEDGWRFALICDEIHHTNEINSSWGEKVEQLKALADYSVFMSGTYFRTDRKPISCIPLDSEGVPIKDYRYRYYEGVQDNVVRPVATRNQDADVLMYQSDDDEEYDVKLKSINKRPELTEAKKRVLDPNGACITKMIAEIHRDLMRVRSKFPDAACLFVCTPGGGLNFTTEESQEDRHVDLIRKRIEEITGIKPVMVTHRDGDAKGKIGAFRNGTDPYLVAINMVSEGCDIPRLRAVAFCRYTDSEMLFRQICGRALRMHTLEDGTAAQIYIPAFPKMVEFAQNLYLEAKSAVEDRRCPDCGEWPCICPCPICGQSPCICGGEGVRVPPRAAVLGLDAVPVMDGGHLGSDHVLEPYVQMATSLAENNVAFRHSNTTQMGYVYQQAMEMRNEQLHVAAEKAAEANVNAEKERLLNRINTHIRSLAIRVYHGNYAMTWVKEVEEPFGEQFAVIKKNWSLERIRAVADRIQRRVKEAFRAASRQEEMDFGDGGAHGSGAA